MNPKTFLPVIPLGFISFAVFAFNNGYVIWAFIIIALSMAMALLIIAVNAEKKY